MQPTHATSDMPWAETRVGRERLAGAYAWRRFLHSNVRLALGSDFPVESPDPRLGLYAAITRQDLAGQPPGGWLPDQKLNSAEALRGFTADAAWAASPKTRSGDSHPDCARTSCCSMPTRWPWTHAPAGDQCAVDLGRRRARLPRSLSGNRAVHSRLALGRPAGT